MTKTGKKLAAMFLAAVMAITFMPIPGNVTGVKIGVQTVYGMSVYAPSINPERKAIGLIVGIPYAGTEPGCIGSWEKVLDESAGTKITVMDMWIDSENGPMNDGSKFVEGKKYTYQAYVSSSADTGTAPDISTWTFVVNKVYPEEEINWPDGTVTCDKTESKILYTAKFTAKAAPSRDKGTYKLNLANGKVKVSDMAVIRSLEAIAYHYPVRSSESGYDDDVDLDYDGAYDIGVLYDYGLKYIECGKLSTTKIKNSITVKITDAAKKYYDMNDYDYYGALTIQFDGISIDRTTINGISDKTYTGNAITQSPSVKFDGTTLKSGTDYTLSYKNNTNAGTAAVVITGKGNYNGTLEKTFKINKAANPLSIKARTATVKYKKLKKKNQTLAVTKVIRFTKKGQGKLTYKLVSAKKGKKSYKKYFKVNKKTGKVTVKKNSKMKKGTYKVKVKVKAAGNANYMPSAWKAVTIKVKVK